MSTHKIVGLFAVVFLAGVLCACAAEEITITTYYPSPQGSYNTLKAKKMAVGDNYYNQTWLPSAGGTISSNADLVVEGNVGIGTKTPVSPLVVSSNTTGIYALELNRTNTDTLDYNTWRLWNMNSSYGYGFEVWQYPLYPSSYGGSANIRRFKIQANGDTFLAPNGGNVSVGTISAPNKLTVSTNTALDGLRVTNGASTGTKSVFLFPGTLSDNNFNNIVEDGDSAIIYQGSNNFVIAPHDTSGSQRGIRMSSIGRVGIGTNNPFSALQVNGGVRANKGQPTSDSDGAQVGYTFMADGDTGMFAAGGDDSQNSEIQFYVDNNLGICFMEGAVKMLAWGGAAKTAGGNVWEVWSDRRLKKNIRDIPGALAQLLQLKGQYFEWDNPGNARIEPGVQMGFIAQDVEKVFPDWVHESKGGVKTIGLKGLDALTVEAFREINQRLVALEEENKTLRKELERLARDK